MCYMMTHLDLGLRDSDVIVPTVQDSSTLVQLATYSA